MNKQRDSITIRKKIMIGTFLVVIVLVGIIGSYYSGNTTFQLLKPSREVVINNLFQWKMNHTHWGDTPLSVKFINDSTSVFVIASNPEWDDFYPKMNYIEADMEHWIINGFTAPTQENMLKAFKSYDVNLDDYQIDKIDPLRFDVINIITHDTLDCYFDSDPGSLEFHELTKEEIRRWGENYYGGYTHTWQIDTLVNTFRLTIDYSYQSDGEGVKMPFFYRLRAIFGN